MKNPAAASHPAAEQGALQQSAVVIKAEPGQPWPEPPYAGRWQRNPETGDLTLVQALGQAETETERRARRAAERTAALAAANQTTKE